MTPAEESADDPKELSRDDDPDERSLSGKAAGPSGRCHATQETGESWDQEEFAKHDRKKPASVMVEHPAGSNVWYNGVPQQWTSQEVLFRIGVDSREEAPCVWIRLTSSRIWRGSNAGNTWKYSGKGAWKPKGGRVGKLDKGAKSKAKPRKRKLQDEKQGSAAQNDELTCTTKATVQPDSDEENVIDQCPSPLPFKGSNAVSPEGEGHKPGFRKQQEEQDGADMLKMLADKLVCKEEGDQGKDLSPGVIDLKYSAWMYRHHRLLQKQGLLNLAPEGCNPEAGRSLGSGLVSSEQEGGRRMKETSSSSGSARLKQEASHNGAAKKWGFRQSLSHLALKEDPDFLLARSRAKPVTSEVPRSPSPSTPSKPADGSRRQRSSSADLDPRSHTAGQSLNERDAKKGARSSGSFPAENCSRQQSVKRDAIALTPPQAQKPARESPTNSKKVLGRTPLAADAIQGTTSAKEGKASKRPKPDPSFKQAKGGVVRASKRQLNGSTKPIDSEQLLSLQATLVNPVESHSLDRKHSMPQKSHAAAQLPALVETDPFAKNDVIRCKAC